MQAKNTASFRWVPFYDFWHELATPTAAAADDDEDNVADLPREYKQTKTEKGTKLCSFVEHSLSLSLNLFAFAFVFVFVFAFGFIPMLVVLLAWQASALE